MPPASATDAAPTGGDRAGEDDAEMRVGIVDVGSNTIRLLVAQAGDGGPVAVREERTHLGLGQCIEHEGAVPPAKLAETAACADVYARIARTLAVGRLAVVVTAPGRQAANSDELVRVLGEASRAPVRVLSPEEEGRYAYLGALAGAGRTARTIGVCDVGGGSTELVVGRRGDEPSWAASLDVGSLRLTSRHLPDDPPGRRQLEAAAASVERHLGSLSPPRVDAALATGGSARALRRLTGARTLTPKQLRRAQQALLRRSAAQTASRHDIDEARAATLLAGALILAAVQERLDGIPFAVARGGLREGLAGELVAELRAA